MKNVLVSLTSLPKVSQIPTVTSMIHVEPTHGGPNVVKHLKSTIQALRIDYWLTSNRIADKVTKSDMIDSGDRQDHTPIVLEIDL